MRVHRQEGKVGTMLVTHTQRDDNPEKELETGTAISPFTRMRQRECIQDIIKYEKISTVFQPVMDLAAGRIFAYEALSRIRGKSMFNGPEDLFSAARLCGLTPALELTCITAALKKADELGLEARLSVNLCPSIFISSAENAGYLDKIHQMVFGMRDRLIVELTEKFLIRDDKVFKKTTDLYRKQGFRIAIDDLGSGYAGLKMLTQIEPYMVKIDRFLTSGVDRSPKKQLLMSSLVDFCHRINALVVAEGVETREELDCVASLNVDLVQGYFLARPACPPHACSQDAAECLVDARSQPGQWSTSNFVGALAQFVEPVAGNESVENVINRFQASADLSVIPVVEGNRPIGAIHKSRLFYRLGQRFGYDLLVRKPVRHIMEKILTFEAHTALEDVSRKVLTREQTSVYDAALVIHNGGYLGVAFVHHILEAITQQKIHLAKQANPLTGLPGNHIIKQEIQNRLSMRGVFAVMYCDLDNFKPFNDHFGFEKGDQVIRLVANLLRDVVGEWDPLALIGHVGGDDFVVVCRSRGIEDTCASILEKFDRQVRDFHSREVVEQGCYSSRDRTGSLRIYDLLSLSIAVLMPANRRFDGYAHLASVASEVKKKAKSIRGSSFHVDQRAE